jgi:hypothetical protein
MLICCGKQFAEYCMPSPVNPVGASGQTPLPADHKQKRYCPRMLLNQSENCCGTFLSHSCAAVEQDQNSGAVKAQNLPISKSTITIKTSSPSPPVG